jgi:lipopolysaccharide export LptBFGC system permease protein LptF
MKDNRSRNLKTMSIVGPLMMGLGATNLASTFTHYNRNSEIDVVGILLPAIVLMAVGVWLVRCSQTMSRE